MSGRPSCERLLAGGRAEHGFQDGERGEQNSLETSLFPASDLRAEGLEGHCAVSPGDWGVGGQGQQGLHCHAEPGPLAEMVLRLSLTPELAYGSPHLSQVCPARPQSGWGGTSVIKDALV